MPEMARINPRYWYKEKVFHSWNKNSPTNTEPMVNRESTVAELTVKPSLDVTSPKVIKTKGEISITAKNQILVSLFSFPAQIVLMEFAVTATRTAPTI